MPVGVILEAFNPFIPLNDRDSSIPVAILRYHLKNTSRRKLRVSLYGNLSNIVGAPRRRWAGQRGAQGPRHDRSLPDDGQAPAQLPRFGSMSLATPWEEAGVWRMWKDGGLAKFWEAITESDEFPPKGEGTIHTGSPVVAHATIPPAAGEAVIPFFLTWHFPIFEHWQKRNGSRVRPHLAELLRHGLARRLGRRRVHVSHYEPALRGDPPLPRHALRLDAPRPTSSTPSAPSLRS